VQRIATADRTVAPFLFDVMGALSFPAAPLQTFGQRRWVFNAHAVPCLVEKQALTSRTVGQRVPRVIWQKRQGELFPDREPRDSPCRVCRRTGGGYLLVVDTVASCGI